MRHQRQPSAARCPGQTSACHAVECVRRCFGLSDCWGATRCSSCPMRTISLSFSAWDARCAFVAAAGCCMRTLQVIDRALQVIDDACCAQVCCADVRQHGQVLFMTCWGMPCAPGVTQAANHGAGGNELAAHAKQQLVPSVPPQRSTSPIPTARYAAATTQAAWALRPLGTSHSCREPSLSLVYTSTPQSHNNVTN
jgi:hypothetical protein